MRRICALVAVAALVGCGTTNPKGEKLIAYTKFLGHGTTEAWVAHLDGTGKRRVVKDAASPVVSPDGRWIAFSGDCSVGDCENLYVVSAHGGRPRLLTRFGDIPQWDPHSRWIVARRSRPRTLVRIDRKSGRSTVLAHGDVEAF